VRVSYVGVLDEPVAKLETGQGGYERALVAASPRLGGGHLLGAVELEHKDGPWVNPDDYRKLNAALRYSRGDDTSGFTLTGLYYGGDWNATDQVPERAVKGGSLPRFGAIDASDGGRSRRASLSGEWQAAHGDRLTRVSAFALRNELNLWSNFTYALDDPANGDQFEQEDRRYVFGVDVSHEWTSRWAGRRATTRLGAGARYDYIGNVGLYATRERARLSTTRSDAVRETGLFAFAESTYAWTPHFRSTARPAQATATASTSRRTWPSNSGSRQAGLLSPKLSLAFGPWGGTELYANAGFGFHSNDARGTTIRVDPKTGEPAAAVDALVRAKGAELGVRTLAIPKVHATLALWGLDLASEQLYVGDAGHHRAEPPEPTPGLRVRGRLAAQAVAHAGRERSLVAGSFHESRPRRRPDSVGDRRRRHCRCRRQRPSRLAREPALALLRPALSRRGRQRALEARERLHRPAGLPLQAGQPEARHLQPVRRRGLRHRLLLCLSPARRAVPGPGRPPLPPDGAAHPALRSGGAVLGGVRS
jgi:hypothetical protein